MWSSNPNSDEEDDDDDEEDEEQGAGAMACEVVRGKMVGARVSLDSGIWVGSYGQRPH